MKINRRIKRSTKQYIIVALICIIVIGGAATLTSIIITAQIKEEYQALLNTAHQELEANQKNAYIALTDINCGDVIQMDKVEKKTVYSSQPQDTFISQEDIGMTALVDIPAGTQILSPMLTDNSISDELREVEYQVININSNIANNDTVDIRLCYPNGESYVVLSKKIIRGYTAGNTSCYFWNDEEEILRMSAAVVDASLYSGSTLFVTKYIEPNIQEASVVNYTPSISILSLLESDPNILEKASQELGRQVRKALENRLADSLGTDISTISWDLDPNSQPNLPTAIPQESLEKGSVIEIPPSQTDIESKENTSETQSELGSGLSTDDYFYYTEEQQANESDIEFGE